MYYHKCCVPGCNSVRQDVMLHKFPNCQKRLRKWLKTINCSSLRAISLVDQSKLLVCHKHFEARFLTKKGRLLVCAYPTLFSPEEISSGIPSESLEASENISPNRDHNYTKRRHYDHTYAHTMLSDQTRAHVLADPKPSTSKVTDPVIDPAVDQITSTLAPVESLDGNLQQYTAVLNKTSVQTQCVPPTSKVTELVIDPVVDQITSTLESVGGNVQQSTVVLNKTSLRTQRTRKRILPKITSLTPNCKRLYREYRKSQKMLSFHCRAKKALKFSEENSFEKLTSKMNPMAKQIMWMQVKLQTKEKKGRRFTLEDKLLALSIMKQGPRCYKFLQRIFILPSATTLKNLVKKLNVQPGLNPQIFECIRKEVSTWTDNKKYCSIIFDEMSLESGLTFNANQDRINGFVHLTQRTPDFADHALVFIIKGAVYKWRQVIAYYFCEGATKGPELKSILQSLVNAVGETGLIPVAIISDQGTSFQSAFKSLQQDTRREQILSEDHTDETIRIGQFTLSVIYDPPHLIKGIRNNFLTKDISFGGKRAKWSDIIEVYKTDCEHAESRLLHKLNDEHILPEKIKKMKVKNCVQVLSSTMARALLYTSSFAQYRDGRAVSDTLENTAEVVTFLDNLFDSVNGVCTYNNKKKGKLLRTAVTTKSTHVEFWRDAILKLDHLKFIDGRRNREIVVPSIKNWQTTLRSFLRLWQFFTERNINIMRPRFFNSDTIENFFGQVRAYNYRSNNPDCHSFTNTIKSLIITGFIKFHNNSFNCEDDISEQIIKIKSLFDENPNTQSYSNENCDFPVEETYYTADFVLEARRERLNIQSRAYTAGWVVRKVLKKINNCKYCKSALTVDQPTELHKWVSQREYNVVKNRKLTYASEQVILIFGEIMKSTNTFLHSNPHKERITQEIFNITRQKIILFNYIQCEEHSNLAVHTFCQITIKLAVFNWCNIINKILKGTDILRLSTKTNNLFSKALNKYKKKLKKKNK